MKFDELLEKRHSIRKFSKKKPSWRDISIAINSARLAPAAGNIYTTRFLVVTEPKLIDKIADAANQDWIKFSKFIVVACSNDENLVLSYGERGKKYARQQSGAAIENFWLKLVELGLSTCWVGAFYDQDVKKALKIPEEVEIEGIFPIGYEEEKAKAKAKPKPDLSALVFWEKWDNKYMIPEKKQEI